MNGPILVTGATGFIGRHLCAELDRRDIHVRRVVRMAGLGGPRETIVGDISARTDWTAALDCVTHVVHLAARAHVIHENAQDADAAFHAVNVEGTASLARAAAATDVPLLHVSTIGVHGRSTGDEPVTEASPARPDGEYAASKWDAEERLRELEREAGLRLTVVRPPLVYGPRNPGNMLRLLSLVARGVPLPLRRARGRRSMIHVENLVDGLLACLVDERAQGQTFVIRDDDDLPVRDLISKLGDHLGRPAKLYPVPTAALRMIGRLTGRTREVEGLTTSLRVDDSRVRELLSWTPPVSVDDGLQRTCAWYATNTGAAR